VALGLGRRSDSYTDGAHHPAAWKQLKPEQAEYGEQIVTALSALLVSESEYGKGFAGRTSYRSVLLHIEKGSEFD
jgi:hypothetical protein